MKKRMLAAAMAAVMAVSLAGCSGGDKTTETPAGNAGTEAGKENSGSEIERKEYTLVYAAELAHINYLKSSLSTSVPGLRKTTSTVWWALISTAL